MFFEFKDLKIYLNLFSKKFDAEKNTIMFLHGFAGCSDDWEDVIDLIPQSMQLIAIDLIGYGRSSAVNDLKYFSQNFQVRILKEIIDYLKLKSVILVGYSMGGRLALSFAIKHMGAIRGLVLESSTAGIQNKNEKDVRKKNDNELADYIENHSIKEFVKKWMSQEIFSTQENLSPNRYEKIKIKKLLLNKEMLACSLRGFGTGQMKSLWNNLSYIECPVLLITGEYDKKFCEINSRMNKLIPDSTHCIVKNSGHNIHLENPEEFVNLLMKFVKSVN